MKCESIESREAIRWGLHRIWSEFEVFSYRGDSALAVFDSIACQNAYDLMHNGFLVDL